VRVKSIIAYKDKTSKQTHKDEDGGGTGGSLLVPVDMFWLLVEDDTLAKPFELNRSKTDAKKKLEIRRKVMLLKLSTQKCISSKSYAKKLQM
jgi:hypothetical protein